MYICKIEMHIGCMCKSHLVPVSSTSLAGEADCKALWHFDSSHMFGQKIIEIISKTITH